MLSMVCSSVTLDELYLILKIRACVLMLLLISSCVPEVGGCFTYERSRPSLIMSRDSLLVKDDHLSKSFLFVSSDGRIKSTCLYLPSLSPLTLLQRKCQQAAACQSPSQSML